ncbi:MAG: dNTP triphosphohydrolase [Proteobacteria bacterium]|nr:MAG: dNTP triphosphohydrolase [Pseudomonadota bacterium]
MGERALNRVMKDHGGFEGNAQTFRILSRLEKREKLSEGADRRCGLNLTARSLAATIKKHNLIRPLSEKVLAGKIDKGIYHDDEPTYKFVLENVYGEWAASPCVVIESAIMDVSDDIAYATYDFEDILKSGFFSPIDMTSLPPDQVDAVCEKVTDAIRGWYPEAELFTPTDYALVVGDILKESIFDVSPEVIDAFRQADDEDKTFRAALAIAGDLNSISHSIAQKTSFRTALTSNLVELFVNSIEWVPPTDGRPISLSSVRLPLRVLRIVETLKHLAFALVIKSTNVAISEQKGSYIVESLADTLMNKPLGHELLPADIREVYNDAPDQSCRARAVCDFIAGMTDHYAMELHARVIGVKNTSIFVPI